MAVSVSVIIVNYNTKELTQQCINSVYENTKNVSYEIILVDNGSSDGSRKIFEKDKRIKYIYNECNIGFAKANNLAYKYAMGEYLFLLNSDTRLLGDVISRFYEIMEKLPDSIGCMGCQLLNSECKPIHSYGSFQIRPKSNRNLKCVSIGDELLFLVDYITGADLFIRRNITDRLGLFDEEFFMYYEDTELQFRYRRCGYQSCLLKDPLIMHLVRGSSNGMLQIKKMLMMNDGQRKYMKKTRSLGKYVIYRIIKTILSLRFLFDNRLTIKDRILYCMYTIIPINMGEKI